MIIDCHTHWGICWQKRDGADPANWLAVLDKHGINKAFLMPHAGIYSMKLCRTDNNTVAAFAAQKPERLIPIGTTWPQMGKEAVEEARRCIVNLGMKGLKFHPWLQGFSTADHNFGEICGLMGELNAPVFFHDGTPCYSLPEQIGGLAKRFPKTKFVLGHSGILWNWRSALSVARHPNIWICLCGPHMRAMEILCRKADPRRILWGTDFGFGFSDSIEYRLNLILRAKIDDKLREKILGENPLQLLGVQ